jgi:uncharacterized protein (DUF1684 family)
MPNQRSCGNLHAGSRVERIMDSVKTTSSPSTSAAEADFLRFRQARHRYVTSPQGPLALVSTTEIDSEREIDGVPGLWAPLPVGQSGVRVTAAASDGIVVDGDLVDGTVDIPGADTVVPGVLSFGGGVTGTVYKGAEGHYIVRVWDPANDRAESFDRISAYDFDPGWVLEGTFTPTEKRAIGIEHIKDEGRLRDEVLPGDITVTIGGEERTLVAFEDEGKLLLVFQDLTTGDETYDVGRFLVVRPRRDGSVELDFNRAYIPPCGFSDWFNCPMPPRENRFVFDVRAGEKRVLSV